MRGVIQKEIEIPAGDITLTGEIVLPEGTQSVVLFAHGSGSSRHSSRNKFVAEMLNKEGFGTLLFDLLTPEEDRNRSNRFDINLISTRLVMATRWLRTEELPHKLHFGYFGASTGAAAAIKAAAELQQEIKAIVSRGGRPDLAGKDLKNVLAPTLLIVGGLDDVVIGLNEQSFALLPSEKKMIIIEGASHLFEEPGKLESVAIMAVQWFNQHLKGVPVKAD